MLLSVHLEVELLDHMVLSIWTIDFCQKIIDFCLFVFEELLYFFPPWLHHFTFPSAMHRSSNFSIFLLHRYFMLFEKLFYSVCWGLRNRNTDTFFSGSAVFSGLEWSGLGAYLVVFMDKVKQKIS